MVLFCSIPELLTPPENVTVFLNQSAVFRCESSGGISAWRINGTRWNKLSLLIHSDISVIKNNTDNGTTLEQLTILGRAEYNGTTVRCEVGNGSFDSVAESDIVTMMVQGTYSIYSMMTTFSVYVCMLVNFTMMNTVKPLNQGHPQGQAFWPS